MNNPLLDKDFLKQLDSQSEHEVYAKIIALTFDERPTEEISGKVTQGSVNIDGTSAVRRSCSLTLIAKDVNINEFYWGLNTKFELYVGLRNHFNPEYEDIIWFKQGIFLINSFNTSLNANSYSISISGKDKMCLLNGEVGGAINSLSADFGNIDETDSDGNTKKRKLALKEIILEAVHHYAGEPYQNIVIDDLDEMGLELLEYRGDVTMFMLIDQESNEVTNVRFNDGSVTNDLYVRHGTNIPTVFTERDFIYDDRITNLDFKQEVVECTKISPVEDPDKIYTVAAINYGDTCGYRFTDLTYAGDLIANAGGSLTNDVLDKIVSMLGDFEYFYDVDGIFHFQRKKTYVNKSWNNIVNTTDEQYVDSAAYTSATSYSFTDSALVSSFQNTPNLSNVRNDFSIWGKRNEQPIHLRYAIDVKPVYYKDYTGKVYIVQSEYDRKQQENEDNQEFVNNVVTTGISRFHVTPIPAGLSQDWWEIDDWARRYMYMADVDNDHPIDYYLNLTGEQLCEIINASTKPDANQEKKDFNYYVYQLQKLALPNFSKHWQTEDWLNVLPLPQGVSKNSYYNQIERAQDNGQVFWAYLFDTAIVSEDNKTEYIRSIEHGYTTTQGVDIYPSYDPRGCGHYFSYALQRKRQGSLNYYHSYIYDPDVPASLKADQSFIDKGNQDSLELSLSNYEICEWREIIYRMALDYFRYHTEDDFLTTISKNNLDYYPTGYTGYEQYYTDMQGFWRMLYDPTVQEINLEKIEPDTSIYHYYLYDEEENTLTDYRFDDATGIRPVENGKSYYYQDGLVTIQDIINEQLAKKEQGQPYVFAFIDDLDTANYELVDQLVEQNYPLYQKKDINIWQKYAEYNNFSTTTDYYKSVALKDLSGISLSDQYYYQQTVGGAYLPWNKTATVTDKKGNEIVVPTFDRPSNTNTGKYYVDPGKGGYVKVSSLKSGKEECKYFKLNARNQFEAIPQLDLRNPDTKYYYVVTGSNGQVIASEVTSFSRGERYYKKVGNSYVEAFYVDPSIIYYQYVGYELKLDLTGIVGKPGEARRDYIYDKDDITQTKVDSLIAGKVYHCYRYTQEVNNGFYYIKDNANNFTSVNVLKSFYRGRDYFVDKDGYDEIGQYDTFEFAANKIYSYDTQNGYISAATLVNMYMDETGYFNDNIISELHNGYGFIFNEEGHLVKLDWSMGKKFYSHNKKMRPYNYYTFTFYREAEAEDTGPYYIKSKGEYVPAPAGTAEPLYVKLDNANLHIYLTDEYDIQTHWTKKIENPESLIFWFDFLDIEDGELAQFSVHSIGNRPKAINDDSIKAIYYRDTPTVLFVDNEKEIDRQPGYTYIHLTKNLENLFSVSSQGKTTFNKLDEFLYQHAYCAESVSMSTIPVYYLEPNTRIFVHDKHSGINGDYIVTRITLPLQYNGTMSISATKAVDRIL